MDRSSRPNLIIRKNAGKANENKSLPQQGSARHTETQDASHTMPRRRRKTRKFRGFSRGSPWHESCVIYQRWVTQTSGVKQKRAGHGAVESGLKSEPPALFHDWRRQ